MSCGSDLNKHNTRWRCVGGLSDSMEDDLEVLRLDGFSVEASSDKRIQKYPECWEQHQEK